MLTLLIGCAPGPVEDRAPETPARVTFGRFGTSAGTAVMQFRPLLDGIQMQLTFSGRITVGSTLNADEARSLFRGERVSFSSGMGFAVYRSNDSVSIVTNSMRLFRRENGDLVVEMETTERVSGQEAPLVIEGVISISCAPEGDNGRVLQDPNWESSFCMRVRDEIGLENWIDVP